nr:hypothetical protein XAC439_1480005 [Xanthomonas citri pv. citri]
MRLGALARTSQRRVPPRRSAPGREGFLGNARRARVRSYAMGSSVGAAGCLRQDISAAGVAP